MTPAPSFQWNFIIRPYLPFMDIKGRSRAALSAVVGVALAVAPLAPADAMPRPAAQVHAAVPKLAWTGCDVLFQCATAPVPLDYGQPHGRTINLALLKRPASDPAHRIGTLFINPGGPSGNFAGPSGRVQFAAITQALGPRVGARFDMVGVDPRGAGGSTPLSCAAAPGVPAVAAPTESWPSDQQQYDHWLAYAAYARTSCKATGGAILDHISTADEARDLDLMRQAVGDRQLSYYGLSYGSYLGETYAALFPRRVRAMAIDGVVDPVALATGHKGEQEIPSWSRSGAAEGAEEALDAATARCDRAGIACPLSGHAKARWDRVRASLARAPIALPGMTLDDKQFVTLTQTAMTMDHIAGLPLPTIPPMLAAARMVDLLRFGATDPATRSAGTTAAPDAATAGQLAALLTQVRNAAGRYPSAAQQGGDMSNGSAGIWGISCVDSANPAEPKAWIPAGLREDAKAPGFGLRWNWLTPECAGWPGSSADAYRGPFGVRTSTPALIISDTHDPNTNITGARAANRLLPGSRVVAVDTWGHTALGKSRCLTAATDDYLLAQKEPPANVTCKPDASLY